MTCKAKRTRTTYTDQSEYFFVAVKLGQTDSLWKDELHFKILKKERKEREREKEKEKEGALMCQAKRNYIN
jgi:hypothetical protein